MILNNFNNMLLKKRLIIKKPIKEIGSRYRGRKLIFSRNNSNCLDSCIVCMLYRACRQYRIFPDLSFTDMTIESFCCKEGIIRRYHVSHLK